MSLLVGLPVSWSIPREYLLVFPNPSISYLSVWDSRGVGASRGDGIGDGIFFWLGGGEIVRAWIGRVWEGGEGGYDLLVFGEEGGPGGCRT